MNQWADHTVTRSRVHRREQSRDEIRRDARVVIEQDEVVRAAIESGTWDFSQRQTSTPLARDRKNFDEFLKQALNELNLLVGEDAGFRSLFVLLNIRPIFVTTDELFRKPRDVVGRIAAAMGLRIAEEALAGAIARSAAYGRDREREHAHRPVPVRGAGTRPRADHGVDDADPPQGRHVRGHHGRGRCRSLLR